MPNSAETDVYVQSQLQNMRLNPKFAYLSDSEVRCLVESFDCHKDILLSKFNTAPGA